ncbi:MAG: hypothetical protein ACREJ2_10615 [Planctomycetota bacterium]
MALKYTTLLAFTLAALAGLLASSPLAAADQTPSSATPAAPAATKPAATPATPAPIAPADATPSETAPQPFFSFSTTVPPMFADLAMAQKDQFNYPVHGDFDLRYRLRWTHGASDQDLYQYFDLDVGDPRANTVTAHLSMRSTWDIDGHSGVTGFYVYDSLSDTYRSSFNAQLYSAYVDVHHMGVIDLFRFGRQVMLDLPITLQFDGGRLDTWKFKSLANLQLGFFGGVPVHLYEANSAGDGLYGVYAKFEPWQGARMQADWTHIDDRYLLLQRTNDLYGIGLWQRLGENIQFYGRYNRLGTKNRDADLRLIVTSPEYAFNLNANWYSLIEKQNDLAIDIDPFTQALLTLFPYWQGRLTMEKAFGEHVDVLAGGTVRQLWDSANYSPNNREFAAGYITGSLQDWPAKGVEADLTWEAWDGHKYEGTTQTISGDLGYRYRRQVGAKKFEDVWMLTAGTSYSLYKYDFYLAQEVQRTRTWYGRFWYKPCGWARWDAQYEHESNDYGDYSTFSSSVRLTF